MHILSRLPNSLFSSSINWEKFKPQVTATEKKIVGIVLAIIASLGCLYLIYKRCCPEKSTPAQTSTTTEDKSKPASKPATNGRAVQDQVTQAVVNEKKFQKVPQIQPEQSQTVLRTPLSEKITPDAARNRTITDSAEKLRVIYQGLTPYSDSNKEYPLSEGRLLELKNKFEEFRKDTAIQKSFNNEDSNLVFISINEFRNKCAIPNITKQDLEALIRYLILEKTAYAYSEPDRWSYCIYLNQDAAEASKAQYYDRKHLLGVDAQMQTIVYPVMDDLADDKRKVFEKEVLDYLHAAHYQKAREKSRHALSLDRLGFYGIDGVYAQVLDQLVRYGVIDCWNVYQMSPSKEVTVVKIEKDDLVDHPDKLHWKNWRDKEYIDAMTKLTFPSQEQFSDEEWGFAKGVIESLKMGHSKRNLNDQFDALRIVDGFYTIEKHAQVLDKLVRYGAINCWNNDSQSVIVKFEKDDPVKCEGKLVWETWRDKASIDSMERFTFPPREQFSDEGWLYAKEIIESLKEAYTKRILNGHLNAMILHDLSFKGVSDLCSQVLDQFVRHGVINSWNIHSYDGMDPGHIIVKIHKDDPVEQPNKLAWKVWRDQVFIDSMEALKFPSRDQFTDEEWGLAKEIIDGLKTIHTTRNRQANHHPQKLGKMKFEGYNAPLSQVLDKFVRLGVIDSWNYEQEVNKWIYIKIAKGDPVYPPDIRKWEVWRDKSCIDYLDGLTFPSENEFEESEWVYAKKIIDILKGAHAEKKCNQKRTVTIDYYDVGRLGSSLTLDLILKKFRDHGLVHKWQHDQFKPNCYVDLGPVDFVPPSN